MKHLFTLVALMALASGCNSYDQRKDSSTWLYVHSKTVIYKYGDREETTFFAPNDSERVVIIKTPADIKYKLGVVVSRDGLLQNAPSSIIHVDAGVYYEVSVGSKISVKGDIIKKVEK